MGRSRYSGACTEADGIQPKRLLDPVHLALLQSGGSRCLVRLHDPFDPLELCHLAARVEAWRFLPRHVAVKPCIARAGTGNPFVWKEPERPRSDGFLDLLGARGFRHPLGHHEAVARTEPVQHLAERLLQPYLKSPVIDDDDIIGRCHQYLPERIAGAPSPQRHHAIFRQHLLAVVEHQPVTQREGPSQLVVRQFVPSAHLRS